MEYLNRLLEDTDFLERVERIDKLEQKRKFCRHGMEHMLSVARIAWIMNLEQNLGEEKEFLYLCAMLHDIGREQEYQTGLPHEVGSSQIAKEYLIQIQYPEQKSERLLNWIGEHRKAEGTLFWEADKRSRTCCTCKATKDCHWPIERRNHRIEI